MQRKPPTIAVLLSGLAAFAPLILFVVAFILMQFLSPGPFGTFARFGLIAVWLIVFGYIAYAVFSPAVSGIQKVIWPPVLLFANILVLPLFWFLYVWRKAKVVDSPNI